MMFNTSPPFWQGTVAPAPQPAIMGFDDVLAAAGINSVPSGHDSGQTPIGSFYQASRGVTFVGGRAILVDEYDFEPELPSNPALSGRGFAGIDYWIGAAEQQMTVISAARILSFTCNARWSSCTWHVADDAGGLHPVPIIGPTPGGYGPWGFVSINLQAGAWSSFDARRLVITRTELGNVHIDNLQLTVA